MNYTAVMLLGTILCGAASGAIAAGSLKASAGTTFLCAFVGVVLGLALGAPACKFSDSILMRSKTSSAGVVLLFYLAVPLLVLLAVTVVTVLFVRFIL